jgi:iron complex outermembrane receptor protein
MTINNSYDTTLDTRTYAAFGQLSYTFFKKLTLTAGLRYDRDEKDMDCNHIGVTQYEASASWDGWSPKFVVDYRWNPSLMTYASVSKGYKAGGYAPILFDSASQAEFDPEYVWSYEVGVKSQWLDNRLMINASAFYNQAQDMQVLRVSYTTYQYEYRNAAEATILGLELEMLARPFKGMDLRASLGLLNAEFDDNINTETGQDFSGNTVPLAPTYTANLTARYQFPWGLYVCGDASFTGETYYDEENLHKQGAYWLLNTKIGYQTENFDVHIYANNLFDEEYWTYLYADSIDTTMEDGSIGDPLTFGVMATVRF